MARVQGRSEAMMKQSLDPGTAEPCLWMSAGLLTYKLCDRDFDCEHCPLDAALRGVPQEMAPQRNALTGADRHRDMFPDDRLYSNGHTWVQPAEGRDRCLRLGLDGFASSLIACPRHVRWKDAPRVVHRGETICEIEFERSFLPLSSPVVARLTQRNGALDDDPSALVAEPYSEGWIVELVRAEDGELGNLLSAEAAQKQARMDLRRFRRRVALHVLADAGGNGAILPDGGERLTDLRHMLGVPCYTELVRELIH